MRTAISLCLFAVAPVIAQTLIDDKIVLARFGIAESNMNRNAIGDGGLALGAYQMHKAAWADANQQLMREGKLPVSRSRWREADVQDEIALAYLRVIRKRLASAGFEHPDYTLLRRCWLRGVSGALRGVSGEAGRRGKAGRAGGEGRALPPFGGTPPLEGLLGGRNEG